MTDPAIAAGVAAAEAILPATGPDGALAAVLLSQGLAAWSAFSAKMAAGTLTTEDLQSAADTLNVDVAKLAADIAAAP